MPFPISFHIDVRSPAVDRTDQRAQVICTVLATALRGVGASDVKGVEGGVQFRVSPFADSLSGNWAMLAGVSGGEVLVGSDAGTVRVRARVHLWFIAVATVLGGAALAWGPPAFRFFGAVGIAGGLLAYLVAWARFRQWMAEFVALGEPQNEVQGSKANDAAGGHLTR